MVLCTEIMFFSVALNFIFFAIYTYSDLGQIYALLIITTAAADTAIGLSLLTLSYRLSNKISYDVLITLRG
jgi:NADH-quinone oxidoreductase subunit K